VLCVGQSFQQPGGFVRRVVPGEFGLQLARPLAVTQLGQHLLDRLVDLLRRGLVGLEATGTSSSTSASREDAISSSAFVAAVSWVTRTTGRSASTLSSHQADNPESTGSSGHNAATKCTSGGCRCAGTQKWGLSDRGRGEGRKGPSNLVGESPRRPRPRCWVSAFDTSLKMTSAASA
jgi:hypothetical protein